jgi:hypothetical protein
MQILQQSLIRELNEHKIFCIPQNEGQRMAYYVLRPWGNYLFFPHPDVTNMYPFFKGQGGIYKVFDTTVPFPFYNGELFRIFGASTVGSPLTHHTDFLVEEFGKEYFDQDLLLQDGVFDLQLSKLKLRFFDLYSTPSDTQNYDLCRLARIEGEG